MSLEAPADLDLLDAEELALVKLAAQYPRTVEAAALAHEPHRIAFYLNDLASAFHALWNRGNDDPSRRFLVEDRPDVTRARLELARGIGADHPLRPGVDGRGGGRGDALMGDGAGSDDDRLPWLEPPRARQAAPRRAPRARAVARRCSACSSPARWRSWPISPGAARRPCRPPAPTQPSAPRRRRDRCLSRSAASPAPPVQSPPAAAGCRTASDAAPPSRASRRDGAPRPARKAAARRASADQREPRRAAAQRASRTRAARPAADARRSAPLAGAPVRRAVAGSVIQLGAYHHRSAGRRGVVAASARVYPYLAHLAAHGDRDRPVARPTALSTGCGSAADRSAKRAPCADNLQPHRARLHRRLSGKNNCSSFAARLLG